MVYLWVILILVASSSSLPHELVAGDLQPMVEDYEKGQGNSEARAALRPAVEWQNITIGVNGIFTLTSKNYPKSYNPNDELRMIFVSPSDTLIGITCEDFNVEESPKCQKDSFFLSPSGSTDFVDAPGTCGKGTFRGLSVTNKVSLKFVSKSQSPKPPLEPFRFKCLLSAQPNTATPVKPALLGTRDLSVQTPTCGCGNRNEAGRIVGGEEANLHEFPWRCVLYLESRGAFCGASVIDAEWIMTAAHCTNIVKPNEALFVDCGDHDLSKSQEAKPQIIKVKEIKQHPSYDADSQDNDISLLLLTSPLTFGRDVSPVCLPWQKQGNECTTEGTIVTASGWGATAFKGSASPFLKKVDLNCISFKSCQKYYRNNVNKNNICTLKPGQDTCQGDSGGSIDYKDPKNNNNYYAIGVVSWGFECAREDKPGVYTNIVNYLEWIKTTTGKTFCGQ